MSRLLRLWILFIIIMLVVYYLYVRRLREKFTVPSLTTGVGAVLNGSPNNMGSDASATRAIACSELATLRQFFMDKIADLRNAMNDLSGTEVLAYQLKTENMKYQYQFSENCTNLVNLDSYTGIQNVPRVGCMDLASVDDPVTSTLLPKYDTTNLTLFQEDVNIQDKLQTINDTILMTGCKVKDFEFSAEDDVGTINTEELRAKLNELSPYYISPGTLDFVTTYLVGNGILDTALFSSSEILKSVKSSLSFIKTIADKEFS
jgi:hypothetical protein